MLEVIAGSFIFVVLVVCFAVVVFVRYRCVDRLVCPWEQSGSASSWRTGCTGDWIFASRWAPTSAQICYVRCKDYSIATKAQEGKLLATQRLAGMRVT